MKNVVIRKNEGKGYSFLEIHEDIEEVEKFVSFVKKHRIFHLVIGENVSNLNFLLSTVEYIKILISLKSPKCDFSVIGRMVHLEHLYIADLGKSSLDLTELKNLAYLAIKFSKKIVGFNKLVSLRHLELKSYSGGTIDELDLPINLSKLEIISSKIESLCNVDHLNELSVYYCSNLRSINFGDSFSIKKITLENCKTLKSLNGISCLANLEILIIDNCPSLGSLTELENLHKLKHVVLCGSTMVERINLSFLNSIDHFYWQRKESFLSRNRNN